MLKRYFCMIVIIYVALSSIVLANENTTQKEVTDIQHEFWNNTIKLKWTLPNEEEINKVIVIRDDNIYVGYERHQISDKIKENTTYTYKLITVDKYGNKSQGVIYKVDVGNVFKPGRVSNIKFKPIDDNAAKISWVNPDDADFEKTLIYRINPNSDKEYIGSTTEDYFIVKNIEPDYRYNYSIVTVDEAGNKKEFNSRSFFTNPNKPTNIRVLKITDSTIDISWDKNENPERVKYTIYSSEEVIYDITDSKYQLKSLKSNKLYRIEVVAIGEFLNNGEKPFALSDALFVKTQNKGEKPKIFSANSPSFIDTVGHWAENDISFMEKEGVVKGKSYKIFDPKANVTRAEFITFILRAINIPDVNISGTHFKDVKENKWYCKAVERAYRMGLIDGYHDGTFRPNNPITREEATVILTRTLKKYEDNLDDSITQLVKFKDNSKISDWAEKEVATALNIGLIYGMNDGKFNPKQNTSRAESVVMLKRFYNRLDKIPPSAPIIYNSGYINKEQASNYIFNGEGEPGAKIYLKYMGKEHQQKMYYSNYQVGIVNNEGKFSFKQDFENKSDGTYVMSFLLEDKYGNKSDLTRVKLAKDTILEEIKPNPYSYINSYSQNLYIYRFLSSNQQYQTNIKFSQENIIKEMTEKTIHGHLGIIFDSSIFKDGEVDVNITYTDRAGNSGTVKTTILKDTIPPRKPTITNGSLIDETLILEGKVQKDLDLFYTISHNNEVLYARNIWHYYPTENYGTFKAHLFPGVFKNDGQYTIKLWSQDKAGNKSTDYDSIILTNFTN